MLPRTAAAIAALLCGFASSAAALHWTPIVHTGDPAVGLPGDLTFTEFGVFEKLGASGEVFFGGDTGSLLTTATEPIGLYRAAPMAPLEMIVDYGDAPDLEIRHPIGLAIDTAGDWVFATQSEDPAPGCDPGTSDARDERLLRSDGLGGVETLAMMGTAVVNAPDDLRYAGFARWTRSTGQFEFKRQELQMNGAGAIAFGGVVAADPCGSDLRDALLAAEPGGRLQLVALQGEPAPGAPDGMVFDSLVLSPAALDDGGALVFFSTLASDTEKATAVYRWDPVGGLALVATPLHPTSGQTKPVPPQWVVAGPSGAIAYFYGSDVWGPDGAGGVTLRVAPGDPVPGGPEGAVFTWFGSLPYTPNRVWVDAGDRIAFAAAMQRPGVPPEPLGEGLFRAAVDGPVEQLVRTGDSAPHSGGATFGESFAISAVGDDGEIAFVASLDRPDGDPADPEFAAYVVDASGRLFPILLASDVPALLPVVFDASAPQRASFAFDATLSRVAMSPFEIVGPDAVFVASVPEPTARATALAGIAVLLAARRRRREASPNWV